MKLAFRTEPLLKLATILAPLWRTECRKLQRQEVSCGISFLIMNLKMTYLTIAKMLVGTDPKTLPGQLGL